MISPNLVKIGGTHTPVFIEVNKAKEIDCETFKESRVRTPRVSENTNDALHIKEEPMGKSNLYH